VKSQFKKTIAATRAELDEQRAAVAMPKGVRDVYALVAPHYEIPEHLGPFLDALDRAVLFGDVRLCFHAPPQHGKTTAICMALVFAGLLQKLSPRPSPPHHAYSTFNDDRAGEVAVEFKYWANLAGLNPKSRARVVRLDGGTKIKFSRNITGTPIRRGGLHIVDDPVSDEGQVTSDKEREALWSDFTNVYLGRAHPGASLIVMMHRWGTDDLIGRLTSQYAWPYIRLAAICDGPDDPLGRAPGAILWNSPALGRTPEWYDKQRLAVGKRTWDSIWQGSPRPEGGVLFGPATYYEAGVFPPGPHTNLWGLDLAYTEDQRADYSVLLGARYYHWSKGIYLTRRFKEQWQADRFNPLIRREVSAAPGPCIFIGAKAEQGTAQLMRAGNPEAGVPGIPSLRFILANGLGDKYAKAWPVAERLWNAPATRIFVPRPTAWAPDFTRVVENFTGDGTGHDDDVDALVALCMPLLRGLGAGGREAFSAQQRAMTERYGRTLRGRSP
jgi:hypothetical protein